MTAPFRPVTGTDLDWVVGGGVFVRAIFRLRGRRNGFATRLALIEGTAGPLCVRVSWISAACLGVATLTALVSDGNHAIAAAASPGCTSLNGSLNGAGVSTGLAIGTGFSAGDVITGTATGTSVALRDSSTGDNFLEPAGTGFTYVVPSNTSDRLYISAIVPLVGRPDVVVTWSCTPAGAAAAPGTANHDSQNLRALEVAATKFVATVSGQAITGAIDSHIGDAFSAGGPPVTGGPNGLRFNFAAEPPQSPSATDEAFSAALGYAAKGFTKAPPTMAYHDWSAWADVRGTGFDQNDANGMHGRQFNLTGGVGYKLTPDLLVGMFGGYENFDFNMLSIGGLMTGDGGTVGGYAAWRIAEHWRIDGKVGWSDISYNGTAGTASGSFTGSRWLGGGGLTGTYRLAGYMLEPSARIYALWESDNAFTDSLGTAQAARNFSEGRVSAGAKVTYPWQIAPDVTFAPYMGAYGDFRFSTDNALPVGTPFVGVKDGWSARVTYGLALNFRNGPMLLAGGEFGGIGAGYDIWSMTGRVMWPF
jgi:hypothetical protein